MAEHKAILYSFGPFRLDAAEGLTRAGAPVPLTRKAVEVLLALVRQAGSTVGKDLLLREVWPDTYVEDTTIAQNIFTLRRALGKTPDGGEYIQNVPRRGYKFAALVEIEMSGGEGPKVSEAVRETAFASLAVLPICNDTGDIGMDYLSLGITESLINTLSRQPGLRVMASSSVFHFKCDSDVPREMGRQLGVESVLAGRLHIVQDQLIIRVELVDVRSGWHIWGDRFKGNSSCLLEIQDELSKEISMHLSIKLDLPSVMTHNTRSNEAYQSYLKGRYFWNKQNKEGYEKSIRYYEQAIRMDSDFALAYSGLADSYAMLDFYGIVPPVEIMPEAREAARKAIEADESLAECHHSLASVEMLYEWDWRRAEHEFRRAFLLNPNYAPAHQWYSRHLAAMSRFDESLSENRKALELDPFDPNSHLHFGCHYFYARQYEKAVSQFQRALELEPKFWPAHLFLSESYTLLGEYDQAINILEKPQVLGTSPLAFGFLGFACGRAGKQDRAREILANLTAGAKQHYVSPYGFALVHAGLGEREQTFAWLEKAFEEQNEWLGWLNVSPEFDTLRADARYADLVRRVGFASQPPPV